MQNVQAGYERQPAKGGQPVSEREMPTQSSEGEEAPAGGAPVVILNPASNRGHTQSIHRKLERALLGGRAELVLTDGPRAAEKLAARASLEGRGVVAVG